MNRVDQVNWLKRVASDIASSAFVSLGDYKGDSYGMARDLVEYYMANTDELPFWFDEHDEKTLREFVSWEVV